MEGRLLRWDSNSKTIELGRNLSVIQLSRWLGLE